MTPDQPAPYYAPPRRRRLVAAGVGLSAGVVAVAAVATLGVTGFFSRHDSIPTTTPAPAPAVGSPYSLYGTVTVGCTCPGYLGVQEGAQVVVVDGTGHVLAVGALVPNTNAYSGTYTFTVPGVPRGRGVYGVHVGDSSQRVVWEKEAQAASDGFTLSIS